MKRMIAVLAIVAIALAVSGCTRLTYAKDGVKVTYEYLFQNKGLEVEMPSEHEGEAIHIRFYTNSDPAIELAKQALQAAQSAGAARAMAP